VIAEQAGDRPLASALQWIGLSGIAAIAVVRCVIVFAPQVAFDMDPAAFGHVSLAGLGPGGSLLLDSLLMCACGIALMGEALAGRRLNWLMLVAVAAAGGVAWWHGRNDLGNLWLGTTWCAAALAGVTAWHVARPGPRTQTRKQTVLLALLLAVIVPVLMRGAMQVTWEHAATIREYEATREAFLASRGWEADSAAARLYERRLYDALPSGWFTTSNIFASLMVVGVVAGTGLAFAARRARMESGWIGLALMLALLCAAGIVFAGSKGGMLAAAIGVMLLASPWVMQRLKLVKPKMGGWLAIACLATVICAVVVRGIVLPEGFAGEKSLLFRWHYWSAASQVIADHPITGVGPDRFQEWYTRYRPPHNPEEVNSAHNVFIDWIADLGVGGWMFALLVLWLVWRCGRRIVGGKTPEDDARVTATQWVLPLAACVVALGFAVAIEVNALDDRSLAVRVAGVCAFAGAAMMLGRVLQAAHAAWVICAATIALVAHGMIEMTWTQPGSAAWAMCLLGVAAASGSETRQVAARRAAVPGVIAGIAAASASVTMFIGAVLPSLARDARVNALSAALAAFVQAHRPSAGDLMLERRRVAEELAAEAEKWPPDWRLMDAAANQIITAVDAAPRSPDAPDAAPLGLLMDGLDIAERAVAEHGSPSSMALAAQLAARIALASGDDSRWQQAIDHATKLTVIDPHGLGAWRRLGDLQWAAGRRPEAAASYRRALQCDRNFALDPLKQLTESQRTEIERRIEEAKVN